MYRDNTTTGGVPNLFGSSDNVVSVVCLLMGDNDTLLSANGYLAVVGLVGMGFWFGTQAVVSTITFEVTPVVGITGGLVAAWLLYTVGYRAFGALAVGTGVWLSSPFLLWLVVSALAFVGNGIGLVLGDTGTGRLLMWLPWGLAFAVGYLGTWGLVDRGGVYLVAGLGAIAFVLVAGFAHVAGSHFLILGVLHGVPMLVDSARGGRELTADGTPALRVS